MSIKPFIFIGVGGTGGKTLGVVRQTLKDSLNRIGWTRPWPRGWQFLHIDVPANPDGQSEALPYSLPRTQYVSLTDSKSSYINYDQAISQSLKRAVPDEVQRYQAWDSWRPVPPTSVKINIVNGAGQYRAIGRVCAVQKLAAVDKAVAKAFDLATNAEAAPELLRIQQALGEQEVDITDGAPVVFVVGSLAGGSGSGMFLDVCDVLRAQGHSEINAVLFTPEVFEKENGFLEPGIAPNTFMALNELANSMWTTAPADAPVSRDRLFSRAGVGYPVGHGGPSTVFLVGRRNGHVTFTNTWDVYKIVGRSLAELALDEKLTQDVVAYDVANAQAVAAGGMDGLELSSPNAVRDLAAFRSLGFSRMSVGRDFFERYAADRIVRAAALRLLDGHLLRRQPGERSSDEELLNQAAEEAWPAFLRDSDLDEFEANNAITDVLNTEKDPEVLAAVAALRDKARKAIASQAVKGKVKELDARAQVAKEIELERKTPESILTMGEAAAGSNARRFQNGIHSTLATLVNATIASQGLPVTAKLLQRLIERSRQAVDSLAKDVATFGTSQARERQSLRQVPAGAPAEFPVGAHDQVDKILDQVQKISNHSLRAQYHGVARTLLDDLIKNLLEPWLRAVEDAEGLLRRESRPKNLPSVLDVWPGDSGVPDYLRPSKVEFLLDEVDQFPDDFIDIVDLSVTGATRLAAVERAIEEVISGASLGSDWEQQAKRNRQAVAEYDMVWSPAWEGARNPGQGKSSAALTLRFGLENLQFRTHAWMWDDEKAIGHYVRETLAHYLTDPLVSGSELADRKTRLLGQFQAMVRASLPLVALDPTMTQGIHGHALPPYNLYMASLNVPAEFQDDLEAIAHTLLNAPQPVPITTNPRTDAMMMTLLTEPYHMIEVASIMDPITDQWSRLAGTRDFWQWRRARPLPEWVPLSPSARRDLVRGWFVARIIGWASTDPTGKELSLQVGNRVLPLARSSLRPATRRDHVGMVVEGVAMAMLEAYRSRSLESLDPFRTLILLGNKCIDELEDENELTDWVSGGIETAAPEFDRIGADLSDVTGRRQAALDLVATWEASYRKDLDNLSGPEVAQRHSTVELNADILEALLDIKGRLGQIDDDDIR